METLLAEQDTKPAAAAPAPTTETPKAPAPEASKPPEQSTQSDKPASLLGSEQQPETKVAAPVAYDLKAPKDSALDQAHIDGVKAFAEANKLDPKVAQAVLDRDATLLAAHQQAQTTDWHERQVPEWKAALKADKELGGANYARTDARATKALTEFWGADFMQRGIDSGLIFEPDFVRGLAKLGAAMEAGGHVAGGVSPGTRSTNDLRGVYDHPTSAPMFAGSNGAAKE